MSWIRVDSSVFLSAQYNETKHILDLLFRSGDHYRYFDVPPEEFQGFMAAESKGGYFAENIRERYTYQLMPRARRASGG